MAMVKVARTVWVVGLVMLMSCSSKNRDQTGLWRKIVRSGDQLYSEREDLRALDQAIQWYLSGDREFPGEPRILGKLAVAYTARAYGHPGGGLDGFATARRYGLACLRTDPSFDGLLQASGGAVTRRAVETLEAERVDCMTWTSLAWSRWMDERGVMGTSIDLPAVKALARRAVEVDPDYDGGRPHAALGLALSLAPKPLKPNLKRARKSFNKAIELTPTRLTLLVDLAQYVSAPEGNSEEWARLLNQVASSTVQDGDPDILENKRAIQRAEALLSAGLDARWED